MEVNALRGKTGLLRFIEGSKSTEIIVIWMEDTAALMGLLLALNGIGLVLLTGNPYRDAYATFAIGALLIAVAILVARKTKSLLIGESATPEAQQQIRQLVADTAGVVKLMNLRTMQLGENEFLAALKIQWDADFTMIQLVEGTNDLEKRIRSTIPRARYVFVEADTFDPEKAKLPGFPS